MIVVLLLLRVLFLLSVVDEIDDDVRKKEEEEEREEELWLQNRTALKKECSRRRPWEQLEEAEKEEEVLDAIGGRSCIMYLLL